MTWMRIINDNGKMLPISGAKNSKGGRGHAVDVEQNHREFHIAVAGDRDGSPGGQILAG